jgi:hypothetical protein
VVVAWLTELGCTEKYGSSMANTCELGGGDSDSSSLSSSYDGEWEGAPLQEGEHGRPVPDEE